MEKNSEKNQKLRFFQIFEQESEKKFDEILLNGWLDFMDMMDILDFMDDMVGWPS